MVQSDNNDAHIARIEAWRQDMDAQMRAPDPWGWLAIVGMYPLHPGRNHIGSIADNDVLLPAGAPPQLGFIDFQEGRGTLQVTTDAIVSVDHHPMRQAVLRNHYEAGGMSVVRVGAVSFGIMQWAEDPYNVRVWDANSPKRLNFPGREWYPIDLDARVVGNFTSSSSGQSMTVAHTGGGTQALQHIGTVAFTLYGQAFRFEAAASEKGADYVWVLARDGTSGKTTYGAGRFLHALRLSDNEVDLDFNLFYHPPCAFCDFTTCPMPPRSNSFPFPLETGERFP